MIAADVELTTCTNLGADKTGCPFTETTYDYVTAEAKLEALFLSPPPGTCPTATSVATHKATIKTYVHHKKLQPTLRFTPSDFAACGANLLVTFSIRVTEGDADGVKIEGTDPEGDPLAPPRFSVMFRSVG